MREIERNDILRFTRAVHVPRKGPWKVALLCAVEDGETATLARIIVPPLEAGPPEDDAAGFSGAAAG